VIVEARLVLPGGRATSTAVLATADHVGRFSLRALGPGAISLVARRGDEAGRLGPVDRGPRGDEDARGLVVRLERGARIVGRIQWASGRPAAGMEVVAVVLGPGGATNDLRATTDREGGYALGPLPPGRIAVVAHPAPSSPSYTSFERPEQRALELGAGEVRRGVDLVLPDGSTTLAGRVLGPDGASVAGATVRIMTERGSGSPLGHVETTVTDLEGRFVARGLAPEPHRVEVSHPDFADRRTGGLHPGEEPTLRLARRSAAVGTTAP
jgi:hypothetical protein